MLRTPVSIESYRPPPKYELVVLLASEVAAALGTNNCDFIKRTRHDVHPLSAQIGEYQQKGAVVTTTETSKCRLPWANVYNDVQKATP